jgi:transcriptional regulator with XRE-family HTH domain
MEWKFRLNWQALVEEAKQRRKGQKLTQRRLGELARVSTPTVSRFENGEKDIQLSSVTRILGVLGLLDDRMLIFAADAPVRYDSVRDIVVFEGRDGDRTIRCAISREALEDHFDGDDKDPIKVFRAHRERIEHEARRKYLDGRADEPDGSIHIKTGDL